jgi:Fe-S cluster biogenesis protein NfuA
MIWADQGELYLVMADERTVALHLRGRFSGCPGNTLVVRRIIEPLISATLPNARVILSSGYLVPEGASMIAPASV